MCVCVCVCVLEAKLNNIGESKYNVYRDNTYSLPSEGRVNNGVLAERVAFSSC